MEVEEFRNKAWVKGETVWVTTESGNNISGTLVSTFKDTVKLKILTRPEGDKDFGWDSCSWHEQVYHCRQIRKSKDEKPALLYPGMAGRTERVSEKNQARRVRCIETGMEYTVGSAAAVLGVRANTIMSSITKGRGVLGYHFEPVGWMPRRHKVAVKCIETGEVFPMLRLAAEWIRTEPSRVGEAIKRNRAIHGYHFEKI